MGEHHHGGRRGWNGRGLEGKLGRGGITFEMLVNKMTNNFSLKISKDKQPCFALTDFITRRHPRYHHEKFIPFEVISYTRTDD